MEKNSKEINGKLIKESLIDYNNLAGTLKEDVADQVKNLLAEQVRSTYTALLNESDDDDEDFDVEQVEDTTEEPSESEEVNTDDADVEPTEEPSEEDNDDLDGEEEADSAVDGMDPETEETETDAESADVDGAEGEDDLADDFGQYKTADGEYDLRNAQDDEIVKVYKLLKADDGVTVVKDDDKVKISDNANDTEYIIELGGDDAAEETPTEDNVIEDDNMNESRIFEIALNEYDSHVGYTDNYQSKDVMTTDGTSEPSKYGRDIDKGVPTGTSKPWANPNKKAVPFDKGGAKNEEVDECGDMPQVEAEATNVGGFVQQNTTSKSHVPNSNGRNARNASKGGEKIKGTADPRYKATNEAIIKKANKIFEENKQLKATLAKFEGILKEAAVTNVNLGGIIKLMTENSTSKEEKKDIINRFTNEAHTVNESKNLYERISNELQQKPQNNVNINEEKQYANKSTEIISESKFYQDEKLMDSLGLMHKICK